MSKVKILVTGNGLVGSALKHVAHDVEYKNKNIEWIFLSQEDADLRDAMATKMIFSKHKPTHVIHTAAKVGGLYYNARHNLDSFRENMAMNDNVLRAAFENDVEKVISCSSTCIFPDKTTYPIDETMMHNGPPYEHNFGYAYAKRMIEVLNRGYQLQHQKKYISVILTNIFGPNDKFNIENGHVLPGLIHKTYLAKKNNEPLVVWGSGKALRQFIYSIDLAKLMIWVLFNYNEDSPLILSVGPQDEITIKDLVYIITKAMKFDGEIIFDTTKSDGQIKKTVTNAKLLKVYPEVKFTPIEIAINETCQWLINNYDVARK